MLYTITINQVSIVENDLVDKTDMTDWAIINYLQNWYFTDQKKTIVKDNKIYVWLNYKHLIKEMPLLKISGKVALSRRFAKLKSLNLIDTVQDNDNSLYFVLTSFCIEIIGFKKSEIQEIKKEEKKEGAVIPKYNTLLYRNITPCYTEIQQGVIPKYNSSNRISLNRINIYSLVEKIISFLNETASTNFRSNNPKTQKLIQARIKEGFTLEDFYQVIKNKVEDWGNNPEMRKYLRPITLFGTKFEAYLNEKTNKPINREDIII